TGSGKTLAGFLGIFDFLLHEIDKVGTACGDVPRTKIQCGPPIGRTRPAASSGRSRSTSVQCIYVSPLRALAYDIEKNLRGPIAGMGLEKDLPVHLRTGDTTQANRARFRRSGSTFLVTTRESLAVMLAQETYVAHLRHCRFVIVDE